LGYCIEDLPTHDKRRFIPTSLSCYLHRALTWFSVLLPI
jgi:hypothetical protein